jgi:predicted SprT family Zn-dependent metalloprotease
MLKFNKTEALEKLEAKALEVQAKFTALGYKPFLFLVTVERLDVGVAGCYWVDTETVTISVDYYYHNPDFCLNTAIPHEMAHLYVNKYFPNATDDHGPEFCKLMTDLGLAADATHNLPFCVERANTDF